MAFPGERASIESSDDGSFLEYGYDLSAACQSVVAMGEAPPTTPSSGSVKSLAKSFDQKAKALERQPTTELQRPRISTEWSAGMETPRKESSGTALTINLSNAKNDGVMQTTAIVSGAKRVTTFQARQLNAERMLQVPPELTHVKGPLFDAGIAGFYSHNGKWSDGMGAYCDRPENTLECCFPLSWCVRLYKTLCRASPLQLHWPCISMQVNGPKAAACFVAATFLFLPFGIGVVLWCFALYAVGRKYNISDTVLGHSFAEFCCIKMCCLCAMNVRVGLHVDRSQGFKPAPSEVHSAVNVSRMFGGVPENRSGRVQFSGRLDSPLVAGGKGAETIEEEV